ncbi:MAG TPA: polysaccharide deacetylase family protein [Opitutaceae bacterium]|nr:polysaccharide deacetylase family protein [Opitutaceae bacterium]
MTLLALMYHRARDGDFGNAPAMLDAHFAHIAAHYECVLPGEPLAPGRLNVCLTFDDAYFDFYAVVFPLLQKHGLRALLAVPPVVVREQVDAPTVKRLRANPSVEARHPHDGGFCTWPELREMADSGQVMIAAHGFTHCRLDDPRVDLQTEIEVPRQLLSARLGQPVDSFVFPYGRFGRAARERVRRCYRHAFRIGGADNAGWDSHLLYRVDADRMAAPDALFTSRRRAGYRARFFWNRLRGR